MRVDLAMYYAQAAGNAGLIAPQTARTLSGMALSSPCSQAACQHGFVLHRQQLHDKAALSGGHGCCITPSLKRKPQRSELMLLSQVVG